MSKSGGVWKKNRRNNLMAKDPHCHWCGIEVIYRKLTFGEKMPDNFATIDHLFSRLSPQRGQKQHPTQEITVLACNKCNFIRGKEEEKGLGKTELRKRSGKPDVNWARFIDAKVTRLKERESI